MMLLPGPVEVPESVLQASARVMSHRSAEFREIVRSSAEMMNRFTDAAETVMTTGSGTTAVESMIFSMVSPGEKVLAVRFGEFGDRMIESLERRGADVEIISRDHEGTLSVQEVRDAVESTPDARTLCLVQNETGNGTSIHNLKDVASEARRLGLKVLVDSVSALGSMEVKANAWGIDAIASCSQKGIGSVPGIGTVSLGKSGIDMVIEGNRVPKYMDLSISLKFMEKDETPYTPATGVFNAFRTALRILDEEGLENRWKRHSAAASYVRGKLSETGASIYGNPGNFSDTIVAFRPPVPVNDLVEGLKKKGILVSRGMKSFSGSMVRIGLMGVVDAGMISTFLNGYYSLTGSVKEITPEYIPPGASFDSKIIDGV